MVRFILISSPEAAPLDEGRAVFLEPPLSPTQRMLQMTTKVPVCADVWILSSFLCCPVICGHGNLLFFSGCLQNFSRNGSSRVCGLCAESAT